MNNFYDNLGLYRDLSACEKDLLAMINFNFFKLDSTWQIRVIDIVDSLPEDNAEGDIYITDKGIYSPEYFYSLWDGFKWIDIPVREGNLFWLESANTFYYFNGFDFVSFPEYFGNVFSYSGSDNNAVARFNGTSGKEIKNSLVKIQDNGDVETPGDFYGSDIYTESVNTNKISSTNSKILVSLETATINGLFNFFDTPESGETINNFLFGASFDLERSFLFSVKNKSGGDISLTREGNIHFSSRVFNLRDSDTVIVFYDAENSIFSIIGGGSEGSGGSRLNLLEDGSFEEDAEGWIVSSGVIAIEEGDVLITPTNKKALSASVNPFGNLRKILTALNASYDGVDGEISFLVKAFNDFNLVINYIDGGSNVVELLNEEITGDSSWKFMRFGFKLSQTFPIRIFFNAIDEVSPSDILLDEVFVGAKHNDIKKDGVLYVSGEENLDGSWRMIVNEDGNLEAQKRVSGSWEFAGGFSL